MEMIRLVDGSGLQNQRGSGLDPVDEARSVSSELSEVAFHLNAMPELIRLIEEGAKAYRHGRRYRPTAMYNLVDCSWRNPDCARHGIL